MHPFFPASIEFALRKGPKPDEPEPITAPTRVCRPAVFVDEEDALTELALSRIARSDLFEAIEDRVVYIVPAQAIATEDSLFDRPRQAGRHVVAK
jgi:hypothetical protein